MNVLTAGPKGAPALVLLHGWGASKEIWKLAFRAPLAERYRLVALDLPGTGRVRPIRASTGRDLAEWVAAEASRQGVDRFAVLGHSMGGNIAVHLAARHPDRIWALALVAPALQSDRLKHANVGLHDLFGPPVLASARAVAGTAGWIERRLPPADAPGWTRGYMRRAGYMMFNNNLPGLRAQLKGLVAAPARLDLVSPDIPVLIMHGGKDSSIPLSWSEESLRSRPSGTRLIVYREALHCPMDTHTQRFCDDLSAFLDDAMRLVRPVGPAEQLTESPAGDSSHPSSSRE